MYSFVLGRVHSHPGLRVALGLEVGHPWDHAWTECFCPLKIYMLKS